MESKNVATMWSEKPRLLSFRQTSHGRKVDIYLSRTSNYARLSPASIFPRIESFAAEKRSSVLSVAIFLTKMEVHKQDRMYCFTD